MNFTSTHNLQLIKNNLVDTFAEHLRYTVQDKTYEDKISALVKFTQDIRLIKDLDKLSVISKKYRSRYGKA